MTDTYNQLKQELSVLYPDVTDIELTEATQNLIDFFTIGADIIKNDNQPNVVSNDMFKLTKH